MNRAAALIVFFSFLLLSTVPALSHATPINGIIFRANVDEMYIEGQPIPIQVQALYFQNSVPQSTSI
ncbi:MAG: hypothetical protein QXS76_03875, partial [Candidatus Bathyarchaeia archaeon]